MSLSLDEYREKLISKILRSSSQDEVKRYIDTALKALEHNKVHGHIISRFTEKVLSELEGFNPLKKDAQQWSNIIKARVHFLTGCGQGLQR